MNAAAPLIEASILRLKEADTAESEKRRPKKINRHKTK
jgi:hypothetical protein